MNNINAAALDGGVESVSFNHVGTQQLLGFVPSGITLEDVINDLRDIRLDPAVRAARDSANADIVIVLLRNFYDAQGDDQLGACGASFIQNKLCSPNIEPPDNNCTVGETYEDYAYGWVSVFCANLPQRVSFAHEIGHIMGGEHQYTPEGTQPNDLSFPWSRGYGNITENISTLMYVGGSTPIHYIQFSNPRVQINGFDSGVDGESENASTLFRLAPVVAGFRGPANEVIFRDSFETGVP